ncbi:DUF808 domain-containing protein [Nocardioides bruguierae]|uniref:DUF808 domain-containing protein n=1 Tax=Nocardioides bruguierae TaxID=2945102 RepID=UPI0020220A6B|nr:DUF808 domain-containing protein [Nocardioides bruguierae]MCL8024968.1 DUF808 domain-containing protein [Nocardioides bruguierae]
MSAGLFALLDDVATLARLAAASVDDVGAAAAKASAKAAGVVIDDTAVTPQYVQGVAAEREVPIIKRIAIGSLRNKLLIILPVALVLAQWLPWLLTPILMVGGTYLAFEGAEKIWEKVGGGHGHSADTSHGAHGGEHGGAHDGAQEGAADDAVDPAATEDRLVAGAVRTDLILSAEIMVISLNSLDASSFLERLLVMVIVAVVITAVVYGVVALIVKMDDAGLALAQRDSPRVQSFGRALVRAMPRLLAVIAVVGTVAMLWVGGHILLVGVDELGWHAPYEAVHHLEEAVHDALGAVGAAAAWVVNTFFSAVFGALVGAVVVAVVSVVHRVRG